MQSFIQVEVILKIKVPVSPNDKIGHIIQKLERKLKINVNDMKVNINGNNCNNKKYYHVPIPKNKISTQGNNNWGNQKNNFKNSFGGNKSNNWGNQKNNSNNSFGENQSNNNWGNQLTSEWGDSKQNSFGNQPNFVRKKRSETQLTQSKDRFNIFRM